MRNPSSDGCSKYHHQIENTRSTAPPTTAPRAADDSSCTALASWMATVAAAMHSPSTMRVNRP